MRHREEELLRAGLRQLVEDVEPRPDALPRLLAARRRRHPLRLPLVAGTGIVVAAMAALLFALVGVPGQQREAQPVSVRPNSYLAQAEPGVIASFDVPSGRQIREIATVPPSATGMLVADGDRVYTTVPKAGQQEIIKLSANGSVQTVRDSVPATVLAARGGRLAYVDRDAVVVLSGQTERRIPVPPRLRVIDLALDPSGRLAALTVPTASPERDGAAIHVVEPGAATVAERPPLSLTGMCGPLAVTWSGRQVAALVPMRCGSGQVRVATLDQRTGQQVGAGVPFEMGGRAPGAELELSVDRLGRFLLSTSWARQWVVDGTEIQPVPPACSPDGHCARKPATFWGQ